MPKLNSNADLVNDLMNFSPRGALGQVFIMEAIRNYAARCVKAGPAAFDTPMLSGDAWVAVATDVQARCNAFYNRHAEPAQAPARAVWFFVRDLTASHPDDYPGGEWDVIATDAAGVMRYTEDTFDSAEQAQTFVDACAENCPDDLDQWGVLPPTAVVVPATVTRIEA